MKKQIKLLIEKCLGPVILGNKKELMQRIALEDQIAILLKEKLELAFKAGRESKNSEFITTDQGTEYIGDSTSGISAFNKWFKDQCHE